MTTTVRRASQGRICRRLTVISEAFALYEWNIKASARVVLVRDGPEVVVETHSTPRCTNWAARSLKNSDWLGTAATRRSWAR